MHLVAHPFFDPDTCSYSYVLVEPASRTCAVIDAVLNFDLETKTASTTSADEIVEFVKANDLIVEWLLETHVHADHLSAARYLKSRFVCAQIGIGTGVTRLQKALAPRLDQPIRTDGSQFDRLFEDGERICIGHACGRVLSTPGHTPSCVCYAFEGLVFVGDTIFMPDYGTGRCDFPGGDPLTLHASVQRLFALPDDTRLLTGHDYAPNGRGYRCAANVREQREHNLHLKAGTSAKAFAEMRSARDATLDPPKLLSVAVPFNLVGGTMPPGTLTCSARGLAA